MGYRSDIRITTSKEGFKVLSEFAKKYLENKNKDYDLLKDLDLMVEGKEQCYFGWDYVKWYDGYNDVDAIMKGLEYLEDNNYSYRYMRIGESYDDCEEQSYDGEKDENIYLEYPNMIRDFDDDNIKGLLLDKQIEGLEDNMEDIDI